MKSKPGTIEAGYYQLSMAGMSLGERWRMSRSPCRFLIATVWTLCGKKLEDYQWLPSYESMRVCDFSDLGESSKEKLGPELKIAALFGFREGQFSVLEKVVGQEAIEASQYTALHEDRQRVLIIAYGKPRGEEADRRSEKLVWQIAFYRATDKYPVSVHNLRAYLDGGGTGKSICLRTIDPKAIAQRAEKELASCGYPVQSFRDVPAVCEYMKSLEDEFWLYRINRGLMVRVPDDHKVYFWDSVRRAKRGEQRKRQVAELEPRREEIVAEVYRTIDRHLRQPSIAQVGGFRPSEDPAASWFGNVLLAKPGEAWPEHKGKPLNPLIQINLKEAPHVPQSLAQYALITVFMDEDFPFDKPNGERWLLRAYESVSDLVPLTRPGYDFRIKSFPIRWELGEPEGPNWEDAVALIDEDVLQAFCKLNSGDEDLYYSRYQNSERTKLGGWPALIQSELKMKQSEFLFQIGSEAKAHWIWSDNGCAYFGLDESGNWKFECQFF